MRLDDSDDDDTKCCACGSARDSDKMLLCDGDHCELAYHTYCLVPPLDSIPVARSHAAGLARILQPARHLCTPLRFVRYPGRRLVLSEVREQQRLRRSDWVGFAGAAPRTARAEGGLCARRGLSTGLQPLGKVSHAQAAGACA